MAKENTTKAEIKQAYRKERNRIQRFLREAKKRGYVFTGNVLPDIPKVITQASVNRLKKITPTVLYRKATFVTPTGEKVTGTKARQQERFKSARKGAETRQRNKSKPSDGYSPEKPKPKPTKPSKPGPGDDFPGPAISFVILDNIREEIRRWAPLPNWTKGLSESKERDKNILERLLDGAIAQQGKTVVAKRLEEHAFEVNDLVQEILYGSGSKEGNFRDGRTQVNFDLARFSAIIMGRSLTVEESKDLTDLAENLEVNN